MFKFHHCKNSWKICKYNSLSWATTEIN